MTSEERARELLVRCLHEMRPDKAEPDLDDGRFHVVSASVALRAIVRAIEEEREANAKVAEAHMHCGCNGKHGACLADDPPRSIAAAIRQRGEA